MWVALALVFAAALLAAGPAAGHAELVDSDPAAGTSLAAPPTAVTLRFSEPIDERTASVRLLDEARAVVAGVGPVRVSADRLEVSVALPDLEPGVYTVDYRVTSAVDGHSTAGLLAFLFDPTGMQPPPASGAGSEEVVSDPPTVATRWLALAALLAAGGTALFWLTSIFPAGASGETVPAGARVPWWSLAALAVAAFAGLAVHLALAAPPIAAAAGHPPHDPGFALDFAAAFGSTPFAWAMRLALLGAFSAFVVAAARAVFVAETDRAPTPAAERRVAWSVVALAAVGLLGMSFGAHAASIGGPINALVDWLHLAGAGAWLGALPGALLLAWRRRTAPAALPSGALAAALRRHGRVALVAVPVVALTGLANSPLVSGPPRELVASAYGNLLVAKAILFSAAVGLGAATHLLARRMPPRAAPAIVAAELVVAALAVAAAAAMVSTEPAAGRQPVLAGPPSAAAHLYGRVEGATVHAVVNVPAPGLQHYQAVIADAETGAPPAELQKVFMRFRPPAGSGLADERVELSPQQGGAVWAARGAHTPVAGDWTLEVIVRRAGVRDATTAFTVPVGIVLPPEQVPPPPDGVDVPAALRLLWSLLPPGAAGWIPAAAALGVLGALLAVARLRRRPRPRSIPGTRALQVGLALAAVVLGVGMGSRSLVDTAAAVPPEIGARSSPVDATQASLDRGARLYLANCAACHGADGDGDGPLAAGMLPPPGRLADEVAEIAPGELAYLVAAGKPGTPMPGFAATLSNRDRWDLVNYLRARFDADR